MRKDTKTICSNSMSAPEENAEEGGITVINVCPSVAWMAQKSCDTNDFFSFYEVNDV